MRSLVRHVVEFLEHLHRDPVRVQGVHGAGDDDAVAVDVDHDGFGDVLFSTETGKAIVYLGSSGGVTDSPWNTLDNGGGFGRRVAGDGDHDGDGANDAVVTDTSGTGTVFLVH